MDLPGTIKNCVASGMRDFAISTMLYKRCVIRFKCEI